MVKPSHNDTTASSSLIKKNFSVAYIMSDNINNSHKSSSTVAQSASFDIDYSKRKFNNPSNSHSPSNQFLPSIGPKKQKTRDNTNSQYETIKSSKRKSEDHYEMIENLSSDFNEYEHQLQAVADNNTTIPASNLLMNNNQSMCY